MDLFKHEVGIAALPRRHRVPGDLLDRTANGLALAVQQTIGPERHFANFTVLEERYFSSVIQQRWNVGGDESFTLAPADDDRRRIFRHNQALGVAPIEK